MLEQVELVAKADEPAGSLSYGQQKLLEICMALMPNPGLVLLDEPVAGVNPALIERIKEHVRAWNAEGTGFLIIEHNLQLVMDLCERVLVLDQGCLLVDGTPSEVAADGRVIEAYLGQRGGGMSDPIVRIDDVHAGYGELGNPARHFARRAARPPDDHYRRQRRGQVDPAAPDRRYRPGHVPEACGTKERTLAAGRPRNASPTASGMVPQGRCNFPMLSVAENLRLGGLARKMPKDVLAAEVDRVLQRFPILKERWKTLVGNMSGGEQQVLEMAMVMINRPSLLLLDEPSLGLAPKPMERIFEEIRKLVEEGGVGPDGRTERRDGAAQFRPRRGDRTG